MKRIARCSVAMCALSLGVPCLATKDRTPLDPRIIAAKSAYIENRGPAQLDGETYKELKKWRRWEIVGVRTMADLVVVVSPQDTPSGTGKAPASHPNGEPSSKNSVSLVHLDLVDTKSGDAIYSASGRTIQDIIRELAKKIEKQEQRSSG